MVKRLWSCVLVALTATNIASAQNDSDAVVQILQSYALAAQSMNLNEMEKYVVTNDDYSVFEGGHINWGWTDYRDHHLGPESNGSGFDCQLECVPGRAGSFRCC